MNLEQNITENMFKLLTYWKSGSVDTERACELVEQFGWICAVKRSFAKGLEQSKNKKIFAQLLTNKFFTMVKDEIKQIDSEDTLLRALEYHHALFSDFTEDFLLEAGNCYGLHRAGHLLIEKSLNIIDEEAHIPQYNVILHGKVLEIIENRNHSNGSKNSFYFTLLQPPCKVIVLENSHLLLFFDENNQLEVWQIGFRDGVPDTILKVREIFLAENIDFSNVSFQAFGDNYLALSFRDKITIYDLITGKLCWKTIVTNEKKIKSLLWQRSGDLIVFDENQPITKFGLFTRDTGASIKELLMREYLVYLLVHGYYLEKAEKATPLITLSDLPISYAYAWQNLLEEFSSQFEATRRRDKSIIQYPFIFLHSLDFNAQRARGRMRTNGLIVGILIAIRNNYAAKNPILFSHFERDMIQ